MINVCIVSGGDSNERQVSLRSGKAVADALVASGYNITLFDGTDSPEELTRQLESQPDSYDVIFPVLHGKGGEDGELQDRIKPFTVPYVGSDGQASRTCFNKDIYRRLLQSQGMPVARGEMVSAVSGSGVMQFQESTYSQKPFVLKPHSGGSSIDTFIIHDPANMPKEKINQALALYKDMLIEELVEGTEITVGVLGNQPLPIIEIVPPEGREFDYENKYNGATQELCPPQRVPTAAQTEAQQLALHIHQLCGCRDMSRTDMIVDSDGRLTVLETNTLPGMTGQSLFPKMAAEAGINMPELCSQLVEMALKRCKQ